MWHLGKERKCLRRRLGNLNERQLGKPRSILEDNIKILKGEEGVNWINLAHNNTSGWML